MENNGKVLLWSAQNQLPGEQEKMRPGQHNEKVDEPDNLSIVYTVGPNINGKKNVVQTTAKTSGVFQI
jgi:hypothetical protein